MKEYKRDNKINEDEDYSFFDYLFWQEYIDDFYNEKYLEEYEYYYENGIKLCRTTDKNKLRQDKIDELLK